MIVTERVPDLQTHNMLNSEQFENTQNQKLFYITRIRIVFFVEVLNSRSLLPTMVPLRTW